MSFNRGFGRGTPKIDAGAAMARTDVRWRFRPIVNWPHIPPSDAGRPTGRLAPTNSGASAPHSPQEHPAHNRGLDRTVGTDFTRQAYALKLRPSGQRGMRNMAGILIIMHPSGCFRFCVQSFFVFASQEYRNDRCSLSSASWRILAASLISADDPRRCLRPLKVISARQSLTELSQLTPTLPLVLRAEGACAKPFRSVPSI